ncbi:MAG TPA: methionyl-tRNA formyltransferase [Candidatus Eisenbacteria bacterium]
MRLVYYGTPDIALPPLARLLEERRAPLLVVTRPDRPRGRGQRLSPSAVRAFAESRGLPVATPGRASAPEEIERVRALAPDLLVVVAYGQILSGALLSIPRVGALNVHFSLLPRHRGASPVSAAILAGDTGTGVTTMWMTEGLDEGPVFLSEAVPIGPGENAGSLAARLAALGAELLSRSLDGIERGEVRRVPQDAARATYAPKITPELSVLALELDPVAFVRRVRALSPTPGAHLPMAEGRLQVLEAEPADAPDRMEEAVGPGAVVALDRARGVRLRLLRGSVWLARVRPSGRAEMKGWEYANGARLAPGVPLPIRDASR